MSTTPEENKRLVRRIREEIEQQGNLDAIDEIFAEDVVTHTPVGEFRGPDAIREMYESDSEVFKDSTETIHSVVAEGDTVAMRLTESGTHNGPFMGIEPTGRPFEIETMSFFRWRLPIRSLPGGEVVVIAAWGVEPERWIPVFMYASLS